MCSYNAITVKNEPINNVPTCASKFFLTDILRKQWNFQGVVVSDCDSVKGIYQDYGYGYLNSSAMAVKAGCDMDCGFFYGNLVDAIDEGLLKESDLDKAVERILRLKFQLGMYDPPDQQMYLNYSEKAYVDTDEHKHMALLSARESIVLLKNDNNLLPLKKTETIAVIGPHSNSTMDLLGNYFGDRCLDSTYDCIVDPLTAIKNKGVDAHWAYGCDIGSMEVGGIDEAVQIARQADVAVLFLGLDATIEKEGIDRYDLTLPGAQLKLVQAIIAQTSTPVVVVLINGGPIAIEWIKDNVPAIIEGFYPGEKGAEAIADVLFGDYNPGGRLPYTIYPADYVNQIPMNDMSMRTPPGRTYRYYTGEPLFEFGYGLSYTTFNITWDDLPSLNEQNIIQGYVSDYSAIVKNTGIYDGDVVVLCFVEGHDEKFGIIKHLVGFERLGLSPGEEKRVFFPVDIEMLATTFEDGSQQIIPGQYTVYLDAGTKKISNTLHLSGKSITTNSKIFPSSLIGLENFHNKIRIT